MVFRFAVNLSRRAGEGEPDSHDGDPDGDPAVDPTGNPAGHPDKELADKTTGRPRLWCPEATT